ncbi:MAG: hypothetical protein U9N87_10300 [Planctomycetota bacterium]|nr:hypothetical protein [Planctomycetota bacterium]
MTRGQHVGPSNGGRAVVVPIYRRLCVRHSNDLGKTWGGPIVVHPNRVNTPRIQKLADGSLVALMDIYGNYDIPLYRRTAGRRGRTSDG